MTDIRLALNADMRRAYREGRKTQSRKPVNPQPPHWEWSRHRTDRLNLNVTLVDNAEYWVKSPFGVPGDTLLLLEPYRIDGHDFYGGAVRGIYLDDNEQFQTSLTDHEWHLWLDRKQPHAKTSSRFMPNSLVRHRETVKRVWVERVQNITPEDVIKEGLIRPNVPINKKTIGVLGIASSTGLMTIDDFAALWNSIYAKNGFGWDANPWVWCVDWSKE